MKIMSIHLRIGLSSAVLAVMVVAGQVAGASAASPTEEMQRQTDRATQLLFEAVHTNDFAGTEAAVAAGARIEARDRWNSTPVDLAVDKGYFRIAHFLVSVRNARQQAAPAKTGGTRQVQPAAAAPPAPSLTPPQRRMATPTPSAAPQRATWPTDRPNPFDPQAPAFGTDLPVVGQVRNGRVGSAPSTATGTLLATETPAADDSQGIR